MDRHDLEAIALAIRDQLRPGLAPTDAVPFAHLTADRRVSSMDGSEIVVRVLPGDALPHDVWGVTTFDADRAWIWLNREAWPELRRDVPRTRFTVAHELGHVVLHGDDALDLDGPAEPDHQEQIEREANIFAAHLLIPDAGLKRLGPISAEALARRFGVSSMMASRRLAERLLAIG